MLGISMFELIGAGLPGIEMTTQLQEHLDGRFGRLSTWKH
jgi:NADH dehydrogenase FAD-containing subunit